MSKFLGAVKTIVKRAIQEKRSGDERRDELVKIKKPNRRKTNRREK